MLKLGIIGHGFVGKAVDYGFSVKAEKFIVDPNYGTTIEQLAAWKPDAVFICVPTPIDLNTGAIDTSILCSVLIEIYETMDTSTLLVLKSTCTPDIVEGIAANYPRFVYNPEFLTEKHANQDFINPPMQVFGSYDQRAFEQIESMYMKHTICKKVPFCRMSPKEASLVKYTINSFLSVKVAFFNQVYDLFEKIGGESFDGFIDVLQNDNRLGKSHMYVPGPDGKRGFGGKCFPKDCSAIAEFAEKNGVFPGLIRIALQYNKLIRPDVYEDGALSTGINTTEVSNSEMTV